MAHSFSPREADVVRNTDDNLQAYASSAGQRAHDRGLQLRGSVMKVQGGQLVRERRDGSIEVLRTVPAGQYVSAGVTMRRR